VTTPRTGEPWITHSARVALTAVLALALWAVCVNEARADLDANVKRCHSDIVRIGEDPRAPYEQYSLASRTSSR
jgi:hypothetical protein